MSNIITFKDKTILGTSYFFIDRSNKSLICFYRLDINGFYTYRVYAENKNSSNITTVSIKKKDPAFEYFKHYYTQNALFNSKDPNHRNNSLIIKKTEDLVELICKQDRWVRIKTYQEFNLLLGDHHKLDDYLNFIWMFKILDNIDNTLKINNDLREEYKVLTKDTKKIVYFSKQKLSDF